MLLRLPKISFPIVPTTASVANASPHIKGVGAPRVEASMIRRNIAQNTKPPDDEFDQKKTWILLSNEGLKY